MSWGEVLYALNNAPTGIPPSNMANIIIHVGDKLCRLKFKEPSDTIIDGQTVCTVKGVIVVRKAGSMPQNVNDGTVILINEDLGKYADTEFIDSGLTNNTEYFYRFFPYSDHGVTNYNMANVKSAIPVEYELYGFKINKNDSNPDTRITYLEMAEGMTPAHMDYTTGKFDYGDWEDAFFFENNKPYMVKSDGTIDYELDPDDYSKKLDGSASDVSNTSYDGNCMARMDTVWLYQYEDTNYEYCYICNKQLNSNYHAYAHQRSDGTVADYILLSCFEGALSSSKIRSIKGLTPMNTQTGTNEITYAKNNGSLWYTRTWSQRNLINMLLLLIGRSDDYQTTFGYGYYTGGSSSSPNYLPTGYGSAKGRFYGSKATRDVVKVFHIENWWGNIWERIAGLINKNGKIVVKMTPTYNTDGTGYTDTGLVPAGTSGGYIDKTNMSQYGRIGYNASGSQTTYACDGLWYNNGQVDYAIVGGCSGNGFLDGGSCLYLNDLVSFSYWGVGASLTCEQPAA